MNLVENKEAAISIIEEINALELKLNMLKQHINPDNGHVNEISIVSKLYISSHDSLDNIRDLLIKFM